jgi:hypothetical protein
MNRAENITVTSTSTATKSDSEQFVENKYIKRTFKNGIGGTLQISPWSYVLF